MSGPSCSNSANFSGSGAQSIQIGQNYGSLSLTIHNGPHRSGMQRICALPFPPNEKFVGRDNQLDSLYSMLIDNGPSRAVISGLGGVGKTQIALAFAYRVKVSCPNRLIFWVPMISTEMISQAFEKAARLLQLPKAQDQSVLEVVCEYLGHESSGEWLLILDNADSKKVLDDSPLMDLLPHSDHGSILITTRNRDIASSLAPNIIDILEMTEAVAREMFEKSLDRIPTDENLIPDLLSELTYLPLAISQAAAYINRNKIPVETYLARLKCSESAIDLLSRNIEDRTRYRKSANAIARTWLVSFEEIKNEDEFAVQILAFMSCIEPKAIPREILSDPDSEKTTASLGLLDAYGFITHQSEGDTYDLHRLVHFIAGIWIQDQMKSEELKLTALEQVEERFPVPDHQNSVLWRRLLPHAQHLLNRTGGQDLGIKAELCTKVMCSFAHDGRHRDALKLGRIFHQEATSMAENDRSRLRFQHRLAEIHLLNSQYSEGLDILSRDYRIWKSEFPELDPNRLDMERLLAMAYTLIGQDQKAADLLRHVIKIEEIYPENHPSVLLTQLNLGQTLMNLGLFGQALDNIQHVVGVYREVLDETDPLLLSAEYSFADALSKNKRYEDALQTIEHVVEIQSTTLNEYHPSRLRAEHTLAETLIMSNQYVEALEVIERVVDRKRTIYDSKNFDLLLSEFLFARALRHNDRLDEALGIIRRVAEIVRDAFDETHGLRLALACEQELASVLYDRGDRAEAIRIMGHVVETRRRIFGANHSDLVNSEKVLKLFIETS